MKKLILLIALGTIVVSCKKTYTCSCTSYWPDGTIVSSEKQIKDTKEEAVSKCANEEQDPVGPNSFYRVCHLK